MTDLHIYFDNSYARLPERFFSREDPEPVQRPKLIRLNRDLCISLGMDPCSLSSGIGAEMFSGNSMPSGADPIALAYAGHQFGGWVPQLGDGRALLLGEVIGVDGQRFDVQLKGSGRTQFSRGGDGRAPLGPVLREYVVSEAMHALGIPTTRTMAAVMTGENVVREGLLPGAVLTRVSKGHTRVGTFEYFAYRKDEEALRILADYVIDRCYADIKEAQNPYLALLAYVVKRQAALVAKWLGIGFIHGVMNTDNTSVIGETIDYGPCAFMDIYDPKKVFSSIDYGGRYSFGNQPSIMHWNLAQFGRSLLPLLDSDTEKALLLAQAEVDKYLQAFQGSLAEVMRAKLGLKNLKEDDLKLGMDLLDLMGDSEVDFTNTFRELANIIDNDTTNNSELRLQFSDIKAFDQWLGQWKMRLKSETVTSKDIAERMRMANPAVIPRNHLIEAAIRAAEDYGNFEPFNDLVDEVVRPFVSRPDDSDYILQPAPGEMITQTFCGT